MPLNLLAPPDVLPLDNLLPTARSLGSEMAFYLFSTACRAMRQRLGRVACRLVTPGSVALIIFYPRGMCLVAGSLMAQRWQFLLKHEADIVWHRDFAKAHGKLSSYPEWDTVTAAATASARVARVFLDLALPPLSDAGSDEILVQDGRGPGIESVPRLREAVIDVAGGVLYVAQVLGLHAGTKAIARVASQVEAQELLTAFALPWMRLTRASPPSTRESPPVSATA